MISAIFGYIINLYFLTIFWKKSEKKSTKKWLIMFCKKNPAWLKIFKNASWGVEISEWPKIFGMMQK